MPKPTFFNLDEKKRDTIEKAALKEFAAYGFHGARLNNIVEGAKIAKGSFYQYFEDLADLFIHLIESFNSQKMVLINQVLAETRDADFFTRFRAIQKTGMLYYNTMSKDARLMMDQMAHHNIPDSKRLDKLRQEGEVLIYGRLIDEAIQKGDITVERDFAFAVIVGSSRMIMHYLMSRMHSNKLSDILKDEKEVENAMDLFWDFIKKGLRATTYHEEV